MEGSRIISEMDVVAAISDAIMYNIGDSSTTGILIHIGAEILGVDDDEFEDILGRTGY